MMKLSKYFSDLNVVNINMFCYLISLLFFPYYQPFNIRFHLLFLTTGLLISLHKRELNQNLFETADIFLFSTLLISIFFCSFHLFITLHDFDWNNFFKLVFRGFIIPLGIFTYISCYVNNKNSIYILRRILIFLLLISTIVAILQYFKIDFAWRMRAALTSDDLSIDPRMASFFIVRDHPMGLSYFSVTYSYQVLIGFAAILSCLIVKKSKRTFYSIIIFAIGLILTFSKSAIAGMFIGLLTAIRNIINKNNNVIFLFGMIVSAILYWLLASPNIRNNLSLDRLNHIRVGLNVILENPYGIGWQDYAMFSSPFFQQFNISALFLQQETVHNAYLLPIIKFGLIAILPIFILIILAVKRLKKVKEFNLEFWIFFACYFAAYAFHIFFHNSGPFSGDQLFWVMFAYMAASLKVFMKRNSP
jgi:hypothetical protein